MLRSLGGGGQGDRPGFGSLLGGPPAPLRSLLYHQVERDRSRPRHLPSDRGGPPGPHRDWRRRREGMRRDRSPPAGATVDRRPETGDRRPETLVSSLKSPVQMQEHTWSSPRRQRSWWRTTRRVSAGRSKKKSEKHTSQ